MITKEYMLDSCGGAYEACKEIQRTIPCFLNVIEAYDGFDFFHLVLKCRQEDLPYVERTIAEFV